MTAPKLFFVHGMWSNPKVWDRMRSHFPDHETVAGVLPYHDADPADPPAAGLAKLGISDYVAALKAQLPPAPATKTADADQDQPARDDLVIVGHSLGALLIQLLAQQVKPRAIVLLAPPVAPGIWNFAYSATKTIAKPFFQWRGWEKPTRLGADDARYGVYNGVPEEEAAREIAALVPDSGRVLYQLAAWYIDPDREAQVDYGAITCPVLIMVGKDDRLTTPDVARATARKLPGDVTYKEMPGFGHWIIGEQGAAQVAEEIGAFLKAL